jgi:hypothetical protein
LTGRRRRHERLLMYRIVFRQEEKLHLFLHVQRYETGTAVRRES